MEQFVELPLEHQIFDMIDASGSDGIGLKEVLFILIFSICWDM